MLIPEVTARSLIKQAFILKSLYYKIHSFKS